MKRETIVSAWHFASSQMRDGRELAAPGGVETWDGEIVLCKSGLHASVRIMDALAYAPGALLRRVEVWGDIAREDNKLVGRNRRILWEVDMTRALRLFARRCALDVRHMWEMDDATLEFLLTGDERLRAAAWDAASAAASAAAWSAASAAASDASAAARAAWDATWDAASAAAWYTAWDAVRAAACDAASDAVRAAACDAASDAAWAAARAAARDRQDARLAAYAQAARAGMFAA